MRFLYISLVFCTLFLTGSFVPAVKKEKVTIVIDPGHGGSDPGHLSENKNHLPEKELNLLIAKKVGNYLEKYLKNIKVVYTRSDDTFPTLDDRVNLANSMSVDYFISVHCNANHKKTVHGTESHVHSLSSKKSVALAKEFEKEFTTRAGRKSRGVKDGNDREHSLQVLKYTTMTSVLVECGFLTNEKEANYLNTTNGQDILASAIFRGFRTQVTKDYPTISFVKEKVEKDSEEKEKEEKDEKPEVGSFQIQLMSSKEPIDTENETFKKTGLTVTRTKLNTSSAYKYKYTSGPYKDKDSALKALEKVKKSGFKDAYLIKI
jgi:N-acetylmuramoyl-L-alanine amidase